jgi:hypothetical protein
MAIVCNAPKGILRRVVLIISVSPEGAVLNLHIFVISKPFNEGGSENVGNGSTDIGEHNNTQPDVWFWVDKHFNNLIPLPFPGSGTGLIGPQSLICHLLFSLGEESTRFDIAIEEEPDDGCWAYGEDTSDEV